MKLFIGLFLLLSFNVQALDGYERAEVTKTTETTFKLNFKDMECTVEDSVNWEDNVTKLVYDTLYRRFLDQHNKIGTVGEFHLSKATKMSLERAGACE